MHTLHRTLHILIVDDDDVDRERLRRCLMSSSLPTTMTEAGSGQEAMSILKARSVDCVLLDNRLGDTTGSVLLQEIRRATRYTGPIIMVTGAGSESLVVEAMQEGASDYLPKVQLDAERLTRAILRSLQVQQDREAEEAAKRDLAHRLARQAQTLRQLDRTLQDVLDHAANVIGYWDRHERVRFGNSAHRDWFGIDPEQLPGLSVRELIGADLYAVHQPHIGLALSGEPQRFEHELPGQASQPARIVQVEYRPDPDDTGRTQGFYVTFSDMTELVMARNKAEESARLKSAFLANMSHEIRTPMNAIVGLSRLALEKQLPQDVHDDIARVHDASMALMGILDDILDHSKLEAGQLRIEQQPVVLRDLLQRTVDLFGGRVAQKGLRFSMEIKAGVPRVILADALRLSQVLNNLVGNAVKFTESGHVSLSLRHIDSPEPRLRFEVADSGPGISAERLPALFQAFTQADDSITRRFGGSGLGLSICKNLVTLMGGRIGVDSRPGLGSTFWFELPVVVGEDTDATTLPLLHRETERPVSSSARQSHWERAAALRGKRALLVEDNALNQIVAQAFMEQVGMDVTLADDGQQAVERMASAAPDEYACILMDMHMPVMDGLEATRRIRQMPHGRDIPIIAMTAAVMEDDRERCKAAGMLDTIPKPIIAEHLIDTLLKWVTTPP
jgi:PAS domain S-box-containing protein